jgi:ferredoxin-NADP reductase
MSTPQKLRCRVYSIVPHGEHVYTVELVPCVPPVPRFKPGQFFHLALDSYDPAGFWPESRVFSIASSPRQRDKIKFTYSVKGSYTTRMEQEIVAGRDVWVKMPYGEFLVNLKRPVVLLAGGTGITAFTAFLDDLVDSPPCPVTVFYGARQRDLLIYRSLVDRCVKDLDRFQAFYSLESLEQGAPNELPGQLSIASVWQHTPDPTASSFYISGPPGMLKTLSSQLRDRGVKGQDIHIDAWE